MQTNPIFLLFFCLYDVIILQENVATINEMIDQHRWLKFENRRLPAKAITPSGDHVPKMSQISDDWSGLLTWHIGKAYLGKTLLLRKVEMFDDCINAYDVRVKKIVCVAQYEILKNSSAVWKPKKREEIKHFVEFPVIEVYNKFRTDLQYIIGRTTLKDPRRSNVVGELDRYNHQKLHYYTTNLDRFYPYLQFEYLSPKPNWGWGKWVEGTFGGKFNEIIPENVSTFESLWVYYGIGMVIENDVVQFGKVFKRDLCLYLTSRPSKDCIFDLENVRILSERMYFFKTTKKLDETLDYAFYEHKGVKYYVTGIRYRNRWYVAAMTKEQIKNYQCFTLTFFGESICPKKPMSLLARQPHFKESKWSIDRQSNERTIAGQDQSVVYIARQKNDIRVTRSSPDLKRCIYVPENHAVSKCKNNYEVLIETEDVFWVPREEADSTRKKLVVISKKVNDVTDHYLIGKGTYENRIVIGTVESLHKCMTAVMIDRHGNMKVICVEEYLVLAKKPWYTGWFSRCHDPLAKKFEEHCQSYYDGGRYAYYENKHYFGAWNPYDDEDLDKLKKQLGFS